LIIKKIPAGYCGYEKMQIYTDRQSIPDDRVYVRSRSKTQSAYPARGRRWCDWSILL